MIGMVSIRDIVGDIIADQDFTIEQLEHYISGQYDVGTRSSRPRSPRPRGGARGNKAASGSRSRSSPHPRHRRRHRELPRRPHAERGAALQERGGAQEDRGLEPVELLPGEEHEAEPRRVRRRHRHRSRQGRKYRRGEALREGEGRDQEGSRAPRGAIEGRIERASTRCTRTTPRDLHDAAADRDRARLDHRPHQKRWLLDGAALAHSPAPSSASSPGSELPCSRSAASRSPSAGGRSSRRRPRGRGRRVVAIVGESGSENPRCSTSSPASTGPTAAGARRWRALASATTTRSRSGAAQRGLRLPGLPPAALPHRRRERRAAARAARRRRGGAHASRRRSSPWASRRIRRAQARHALRRRDAARGDRARPGARAAPRCSPTSPPATSTKRTPRPGARVPARRR